MTSVNQLTERLAGNGLIKYRQPESLVFTGKLANNEDLLTGHQEFSVIQ